MEVLNNGFKNWKLKGVFHKFLANNVRLSDCVKTYQNSRQNFQFFTLYNPAFKISCCDEMLQQNFSQQLQTLTYIRAILLSVEWLFQRPINMANLFSFLRFVSFVRFHFSPHSFSSFHTQCVVSASRSDPELLTLSLKYKTASPSSCTMN
jgi:hypothetical protein